MKYTTIQITKETRDLLQEYCKEYGYKMSPLIDKMIREKIGKPKPILKNVLRVKT